MSRKLTLMRSWEVGIIPKQTDCLDQPWRNKRSLSLSLCDGGCVLQMRHQSPRNEQSYHKTEESGAGGGGTCKGGHGLQMQHQSPDFEQTLNPTITLRGGGETPARVAVSSKCSARARSQSRACATWQASLRAAASCRDSWSLDRGNSLSTACRAAPRDVHMSATV